MKKMKRILAIIGIILLVGLYLGTLILALIDHSASRWLFKSALTGSLLLPVLLYAYILIYKLINKDQDDRDA